jgi:hypothetical protein
MNIKQVISILAAVLAVMVVSTAHLTEVFGSDVAKAIVSLSALGGAILNAVNTVLTSTGNTVLAASNVKGVEVNVSAREADPALVKMAVDPNNHNISLSGG